MKNYCFYLYKLKKINHIETIDFIYLFILRNMTNLVQ